MGVFCEIQKKCLLIARHDSRCDMIEMRAVPGYTPSWSFSVNLILAIITIRVPARKYVGEAADRQADDVVANKSRKKSNCVGNGQGVRFARSFGLSCFLWPLIRPDFVTHRFIGIYRSRSHMQRSDAFPSLVTGTSKTRNDSLVVC